MNTHGKNEMHLVSNLHFISPLFLASVALYFDLSTAQTVIPLDFTKMNFSRAGFLRVVLHQPIDLSPLLFVECFLLACSAKSFLEQHIFFRGVPLNQNGRCM